MVPHGAFEKSPPAKKTESGARVAKPFGKIQFLGSRFTGILVHLLPDQRLLVPRVGWGGRRTRAIQEQQRLCPGMGTVPHSLKVRAMHDIEGHEWAFVSHDERLLRLLNGRFAACATKRVAASYAP